MERVEQCLDERAVEHVVASGPVQAQPQDAGLGMVGAQTQYTFSTRR